MPAVASSPERLDSTNINIQHGQTVVYLLHTHHSDQTITQFPCNDFQCLLSRSALFRVFKMWHNLQGPLLQCFDISLRLHQAFEPAEL